jgi:hypothetical protein
VISQYFRKRCVFSGIALGATGNDTSLLGAFGWLASGEIRSSITSILTFRGRAITAGSPAVGGPHNVFGSPKYLFCNLSCTANTALIYVKDSLVSQNT